MSTHDTWLDNLHCNQLTASSTSSTLLDEALSKVTLAVASLHRAGPTHARKSEALWVFAAGSWNRSTYDGKVAHAAKKLPNKTSARHDVVFAEDLLVEAIALLRRWGDGRDARDLSEAFEKFLKGGEDRG